MKKTLLLSSLVVLASCGQNINSEKKIRKTDLKQTGEVSVVLSGVSDVENLKKLALQNGIIAEGNSVLFLKGDAAAINALDIPANDNFNYIVDAPITIEKPTAFKPDREALYLAKKDFGFPEFQRLYPNADGRGVIVGVIDDGISPNQDGFRVTSTGARKFLAKSSQSTFTTFDLVETEDGYEAVVDENRPTFSGKLDLDKNGAFETYKIKVSKDLETVTWLDQTKRSFSESGDYFIAKDQRLAIMVEIDKENKKIKVLQPETGGDSHGEGVASVLAGHRIGNLEGFDGVAPGAQIADYDLSEVTDKGEEQEYTISTFLKAIDWLGTKGAEVANVSYSIFFTSTETQTFMRDALDDIIKKHNMVVSFSAGNNGPGLGSLNRRSMYPDSALVAGAFVSKELDARVHGVTGIPDEGRVIYYSSRGPGQGTGPTLISPLSSLTNSTPDTGHRAFNGTSSASPALAGAAAVLVSAIKQEGLKVHAPSVVNALRLSGKRLKAEPFVFQGNGLPQLAKAVAIYKKIISGNTFENVTVSVTGESLDKVALKGLTIKTSETSGLETRVISLRGEASEFAPADKKVNLLVPVKLKYSKGITGPSELWVSSSSSQFGIDIDVEAVLGSENEAFGEIKVLSDDGLALATVPVTIVRDVDVRTRPSFKMKIAAQEGKRFHLYVPEGVSAFRVQSEYLDNPNAAVRLSVFDTNQIRLTQVKPGSDFWISVDRPGHYQIGVALDRGTARGAEVSVKVEPISVKLKTSFTTEADPTINLQNLSRSAINGTINLKQIDEVVHSHVLTSEFKDVEITKTLPKGSYRLSPSESQEYDLSYLYFNCTSRYINEKGEEVLTDGTSLYLSTDAEVKIRCMPFELGMKAKNKYQWLVQVLKVNEKSSFTLNMAAQSSKSIRVKGLKKGTYEVSIEDALNAGSVSLGKLEVH